MARKGKNPRRAVAKSAAGPQDRRPGEIIELPGPSAAEARVLRELQAKRVMPLITGLLQAWDVAPDDVKQVIRARASVLADYLDRIDNAMIRDFGAPEVLFADKAQSAGAWLQKFLVAPRRGRRRHDPKEILWWEACVRDAIAIVRAEMGLPPKKLSDKVVAAWIVILQRKRGLRPPSRQRIQNKLSEARRKLRLAQSR